MLKNGVECTSTAQNGMIEREETIKRRKTTISIITTSIQTFAVQRNNVAER